MAPEPGPAGPPHMGLVCPQSVRGAHVSVAPFLPGHDPMCAALSCPATQVRR